MDERLDESGSRAPQHPDHGANMMEVLACHATQGVRIRVTLPKSAKFKHLKRAIAKRLGCDDIIKKGLLTNKIGGVYKALKDEGLIGDVRQVTVAGVDLGVGEMGEMEACLSEGEAEEGSNTSCPSSSTLVAGKVGMAASSTSSGPPLANKGVRSPIMTRRRALALQRELLQGFTTTDFQQSLRELVEHSEAAPNSAEFQAERQELFLSVQRSVLPNYGFEGSLSGVYRMMGAMGPFVEDPEFSQLAQEIHAALGIHSPPETWGNLSKSCQKLEAATTQSTRERRSPPSLVRVVAPQPAEKEARRADTTNPPFDRWPIGKYQPFKLFIAGTWNDFRPAEMQWQNGLFVSPITVGSNGWESFQMLKDGSWSATIYPSVPDAGPFEQHAVCGPDDKGHGKNWQIGRYAEDEAFPGSQFAIVASVDKAGSVKLVHWQHLS